MNDIERIYVYKKISNELALLSDNQISAILESSKSISNSIGGSSALINISDTNIFIKKIRLTDIEKLPENEMSTKNLFNLPLYYQYGVGSTGFGAWRELSAHILSTNWVITGECSNFPILYHWRVLPTHHHEPDEDQLLKLNKDVEYWHNSSAIHDRLEANINASANIILFLEYYPQNLYQWFGSQISQSGAATKNACEMIENNLFETISFMQSKDFIHFDTHFHNIMTDGTHLYFSDFGLALTSNFELSDDDKEFFSYHRYYDNYSAATNFLYCLATHYVGNDNWKGSLLRFINENIREVPSHYSTILKRYAPTAVLMGKFWHALQKDKTTIYPAKELDQTWRPA